MTNINLTLSKLVQTCGACPSQWDAWTVDNQYVYIRYRWGNLTVDVAPDEESWAAAWNRDHSYRVFDRAIGGHLDGFLTEEEMLDATGMRLA